MQSLGLLDAAAFTLIGGIIVFACMRRYETWGTPRSDTAIRINVMLFASFALGISIARPSLVSEFSSSPPGFLLTVFSVYTGITLYFVIQGEGTFPERLGIGLLAGVIPAFLAAGILTPDHETHYPAIVHCVLFIAMMTLAGVVHGVLGPVISAVNVSMAIALLWDAPGYPNLATYFDVLTDMGADSDAFKIIFIVTSTLLGLLEYLRNMPGLIASFLSNIFGTEQ